MQASDVPDVAVLAKLGFPTLPEDEAVFAERQQLYPAGCRVIEGADGLSGYLIAYPWLRLRPPKLNMRIGRLPPAPDCFYIHDMVVHPRLRGQGLARRIIERVIADAAFDVISLVAVNGASPFWQSFGFEARASAALASYGGDAAYMELAFGGAEGATASAR